MPTTGLQRVEMGRADFLVDGFNFYHSILDVQEAADSQATKWFDFHALCNGYLHQAAEGTGERLSLGGIYYFSAPPNHHGPEKRNRHRLYMEVLRSSGVNVILGRFKKKQVRCPKCERYSRRHEEKETDVAIAAKLFEIGMSRRTQAVVIVSGDTDLVPAATACRRLFPEMRLIFALPYKRSPAELKSQFPGSFSIHRGSYFKNSLPPTVQLANGATASKPKEW